MLEVPLEDSLNTCSRGDWYQSFYHWSILARKIHTILWSSLISSFNTNTEHCQATRQSLPLMRLPWLCVGEDEINRWWDDEISWSWGIDASTHEESKLERSFNTKWFDLKNWIQSATNHISPCHGLSLLYSWSFPVIDWVKLLWYDSTTLSAPPSKPRPITCTKLIQAWWPGCSQMRQNLVNNIGWSDPNLVNKIGGPKLILINIENWESLMIFTNTEGWKQIFDFPSLQDAWPSMGKVAWRCCCTCTCCSLFSLIISLWFLVGTNQHDLGVLLCSSSNLVYHFRSVIAPVPWQSGLPRSSATIKVGQQVA